MRSGGRAGAYIGSGGRAIVGTHGAAEFPHAPPVRSSCPGGAGGHATAARARRKQSDGAARAHAATLALPNYGTRSPATRHLGVRRLERALESSTVMRADC
ncbi:unnamed protein product, partial [Iphiclides podalirius]